MLTGASVSWDLFDLLRVPPALGRSFRADEDVPGQEHRDRASATGCGSGVFGQDPSVLGRAVTLSGVPVTVVGVMPAGFAFPGDEHRVLAADRASTRRTPRAADTSSA